MNTPKGLSVSTLSVSYDDHKVLDNLFLDPLEPGVFSALLGPNAAGKSTLFKALAGLIKIKSGDITLNGVNVKTFNRAEQARKIAYLPQSFHTNLALSVFESVLLSLKQQSGWRVKEEDLRSVSDILARLNIEHLADKDICELSGGQKQLVAMARVLVIEPQVILLDEPTSALDLHHQLAILDVVKQLTREKGLITIAALHDVNLAAKYCDHLILLNKGVIQTSGTPSDVLSMPLLGQTYKVKTSLEESKLGRLYVDAQLLSESSESLSH
ncbi:ABC transporter ATP-binding protein [Marinomonas sp.]|nr:ABC transporter ATP-binding protein [Marinomonas sp.]MDB4837678.1 ABC transporter ATP-binding protein [Marinomonas sp.]